MATEPHSARTPASREPEMSSQRVYRGIMKDLEDGRMVPGQTLAETALAARYGVGRNAVREAMQQLAARGVVDLSRHRSPTIRLLGQAETFDILDVAGAMSALAAQSAARRFDPVRHAMDAQVAIAMLIEANASDERGAFSRARRHFYRVLLTIGGNRELQRLYPAIGMHIIYAQYQSRSLQGIRIFDYHAIMDAVTRGDPIDADAAGRSHVDHVRQAIEQICERHP